MKIIKKYTAVQISPKRVNEDVFVELEYGGISGPCYDREEPITEFDTEEEAIKWAYKENKYANWLILPTIQFDRTDAKL